MLSAEETAAMMEELKALEAEKKDLSVKLSTRVIPKRVETGPLPGVVGDEIPDAEKTALQLLSKQAAIPLNVLNQITYIIKEQQ